MLTRTRTLPLLLGLVLTLLMGGRAVAQTAPFGNVVQLNGTTDAVTPAGPAYTQNDNFTLEAWVKPAVLPTATGFELVVANGCESTGVDGNGVALGIGGSSGTAGRDLMVLLPGIVWFNTGLSLPTAGQWYHVAVTRRSGTLFAYLDGVQAPNTTTTTPSAIQTSGANISNFRVGSHRAFPGSPPGGVYILNGQVEEARAWSVGRTQAQIQATVGGEIAGNTIPPDWRSTGASTAPARAPD